MLQDWHQAIQADHRAPTVKDFPFPLRDEVRSFASFGVEPLSPKALWSLIFPAQSETLLPVAPSAGCRKEAAPMEFEMVERDHENQASLLRVRGEIDISTSPLLRERLLSLIAKDEPFEVDLSEVTFLDSSGAAMLIKAWKTLKEQGKLLKLASASTSVRRVFSVLHLESLLVP